MYSSAPPARYSGLIIILTGSPGASRTNTKLRTVIPSKTGMEISRRRMSQRYTSRPGQLRREPPFVRVPEAVRQLAVRLEVLQFVRVAPHCRWHVQPDVRHFVVLDPRHLLVRLIPLRLVRRRPPARERRVDVLVAIVRVISAG